MNNDIPLKDLVLVGGGHAHVHVLKMFGMKPVRGARITLITKDVETPYSGMIPGYVSGFYTREQCHIDLLKLCSFSGVRLFNTSVVRIDTATRQIYCSDGRPPVSYDILSINIGIVPRPFSSSNFNDKRITPVKPIDGFCSRWEFILCRIREQPPSQRMVIAIVGGGGGGIELAFSIHHRLHSGEFQKQFEANPDAISVLVLNRGREIMEGHSRYVL
jgi:selenide,water dikinase